MVRMIDADALKADIEQFNRPLCDDYHMKAYVLDQIITDIDNQPTVDAVPVVHGKWLPIIEVNEYGEPYQSGVYCSECGETSIYEPNYCPNCGARMDGAERKEE